jgi:hypothetical protein
MAPYSSSGDGPRRRRGCEPAVAAARADAVAQRASRIPPCGRGSISAAPLAIKFNISLSPFKFAASNVLVTLFDDSGVPTAGWMFLKTFPVRWSTSDLDAGRNGIVIDRRVSRFDVHAFGGLLIAQPEQQATAASETPNKAKLALDAYHLFPAIPCYLYYVAGFAVATPFLSQLISDTNLVGTPEQTATDRNAPATTPKYLRSNDMVSQASAGRHGDAGGEGRGDRVDTPRVQRVAITGILGISYLLVLFDVVSAIDPVRIVYAAAQNASVLATMPQIDGTLTALLFVSHAALIGSKVFDKMVPGTNPAQT